MPGLEKGATAADTLADATKRAAGQADAFGNSAAGMQARGADAFGELTETIGSAFLPVLEALLPAIDPADSRVRHARDGDPAARDAAARC